MPGAQTLLTTVGARSADRWTFAREGPGNPGSARPGPRPPLKLLPAPPDYDQKAELWAALGWALPSASSSPGQRRFRRPAACVPAVCPENIAPVACAARECCAHYAIRAKEPPNPARVPVFMKYRNAAGNKTVVIQEPVQRP